MRAALRMLADTAKTWLERNAFLHAGSLAFFTLFSVAPLIIIVVAIVGAVFGQQAASGEISAHISALVGQQAASAVEEAVRLSRPDVAGIGPLLFGVGALLFGATTVFAQIQNSLNHFWGVRARPSRSGILTFLVVRLLSLGMVLIVGFLLLTSFALSVAITTLVEYFRQWLPVPPLLVFVLNLGATLLVTVALIGLLFKVLPDVRLAWKDVWHGALVTAVLFVIGQYLISAYLTRVAPGSTYGAAGSLVLVLFWVYFSSLILLFGAALTRVLVLHRHGVVKTRNSAVRVRTQIVEE